jgi:hypothetical protein
MRRRVLPLLAATALVAGVACTSASGSDGGGVGIDTRFGASLASSWHYVGAPQRVQVGILAVDQDGRRYVTGGSVDLAFSFRGADGASDPVPGPSATAEYVPVPGTEPAAGEPSITTGARGIYEAERVVFDEPGVWEVTVSAEIDGLAQQLRSSFAVAEDSAIPAPGDRALETETLTVDSKGVPNSAIDSLAVDDGPIPDRELHEWSIADAIEAGRPALVLFGTPAYCTSEFCGPEVQELQRLATEYPDRAVYIHVEIWKQYDPPQVQVINEGAAEWLLRRRPDGTPEMTEPWLYLIGADGRIVDRWGSMFDRDDVAAALQALSPMSA